MDAFQSFSKINARYKTRPIERKFEEDSLRDIQTIKEDIFERELARANEETKTLQSRLKLLTSQLKTTKELLELEYTLKVRNENASKKSNAHHEYMKQFFIRAFEHAEHVKKMGDNFEIAIDKEFQKFTSSVYQAKKERFNRLKENFRKIENLEVIKNLRSHYNLWKPEAVDNKNKTVIEVLSNVKDSEEVHLGKESTSTGTLTNHIEKLPIVSFTEQTTSESSDNIFKIPNVPSFGSKISISPEGNQNTERGLSSNTNSQVQMLEESRSNLENSDKISQVLALNYVSAENSSNQFISSGLFQEAFSPNLSNNDSNCFNYDTQLDFSTQNQFDFTEYENDFSKNFEGEFQMNLSIDQNDSNNAQGSNEFMLDLDL